MSHGVELSSLVIQDVGVLEGRTELGPFSSGVSVISGRSPVEKATLVEALRAALFERHDERHAGIKALQAPGARGASEMRIELSIGGERVSVHKRFLERPFAEVRLHREGAVFTGAKAEEVLLARLAVGAPGGRRNDLRLWGLLPMIPGETADAFPGDALEDSVRGALAREVGRLVGQIGQRLGGDDGERASTQALDQVARFERAVAEATDLAAQHEALTEQLGEIERRLPALEATWQAAVAAEISAQQLEVVADEAECRLATAEALFDAAHEAILARAVLVSELEELDGQIARSGEAAVVARATAARRAESLEALTALRLIAPDALLAQRRAAALAALGPLHTSARSAAAEVEAVSPPLLRGDVLRAQGAINACKRRAGALRDQARCVANPLSVGVRDPLSVLVRLSLARVMARGSNPLPLILDDTTGWADDGRFPWMAQILREASSEVQIILLARHPARFNRLQAEYAVDLDQLKDARPHAPDLARLFG